MHVFTFLIMNEMLAEIMMPYNCEVHPAPSTYCRVSYEMEGSFMLHLHLTFFQKLIGRKYIVLCF